MPIETVCLPVPTQSRQRNTLPSSIMWKVPITWRAALARPGRLKLAHVPRLGRAFLPGCQRESCLYNDGAPTYTHTAVYLV